MFIETLEFTIPIDLCDLFSTLKKGPRSNLEFPASVNSYGTTQDASIQVALRSNKLTFKVDGVSSDASMISKSECKTLKLSIFDVDRTLMPQESYYSEAPSHSVSMSFPAKRSRDFSASVKSPPAKSSRTSYSDTSRGNTPVQFQNQNNSRTSEQLHSRTPSDSRVNVKLEPEDPDLIEIEPDPEPDDIVPKKETPYMQIDYSSDVPHTQTSQAALDRLSHPQSSHSQSPGSSSSSFHQNVPHVPDYAEPSTSQVHHGDQSADDFLVFQEQDDNDCDNDNDADFDNEDFHGYGTSWVDSSQVGGRRHVLLPVETSRISNSENINTSFFVQPYIQNRPKPYKCLLCDKSFVDDSGLFYHKTAVHDKVTFQCVCGKSYRYKTSLRVHRKKCDLYLSHDP
ncbi:zinc finger protein 8-like isoform X16 [Haliotis cracherodii]|uniref:zinc finger protein 8-like isoform X16 n=1 Tax=Haliotis cracherodii TaxID=6455 RepID=UPI0039E77EF7